ncbi:MAG: GH3 auxin-responsive promoter family protein [Gemmataceae bacterium]|nr:GH3 auxin-responsive promoter family protein [Gemmataceae bacterium]
MPVLLDRCYQFFHRAFLHGVVSPLLSFSINRRIGQFNHATRTVAQTQEALLRRLIAKHRHTAFGADHGFSSIQSLADFRNHLPVAGYERIEPYMNRVLKGEVNALLNDKRIHMFALTSGTTDTRKYIPVTDQYLEDYRHGWNIWGLNAFNHHPAIKLEPILQMSGDWDEYRSPSGVPCGSVTGLTARMQKRVIRGLYCVPPEVSWIKDPLAKYYTAMRLSIPRQPGMILAANPSTMINLARTADREKERLLRDLRDGTLDSRLEVPDKVRQAIAPRLKRHPDRVKELEQVIQRTGALLPKDYWKPTCLLGNWTGGSMGPYLRHYPALFGSMPVRDVGLIASEGRMTIPLADSTPAGVLDITTHFFEFIPEEEKESANPTVLLPQELQEGRNYFILLTTAYGLYRYDIHDVVRCTGFYNQAPLLEFLNKGSYFANITGEKISEHQVTRSMSKVLEHLNTALTVYSLAPCWDDEKPFYGLFIEESDLNNKETGLAIARELDLHLRSLNMEYESKREGRLGPIQTFFLPAGAWKSWDSEHLKKTGGTLEQYKHPCLISDLSFREKILARQP